MDCNIFPITKDQFESIFNDTRFDLPIRWDGIDFKKYLQDLFDKYMDNVKYIMQYEQNNHCSKIQKICDDIIEVIDKYLKGYVLQANQIFDQLFQYYMDVTGFKYYQKSSFVKVDNLNRLKLFRTSVVQEDLKQNRTRIFHVPYNLRHLVQPCRYSIAGYPCLYLSTNLELSCNEIHYNKSKLNIASRFEMDRSIEITEINIKVLELAIKPSDFKRTNNYNRRNVIDQPLNYSICHGRVLDEINLDNDDIRANYLLWYPLIAACSFIRCHKNAPFAVEYIIPQMLMQAVRMQNDLMNRNRNYNIYQMTGVRYFSCSSKRASDMGFNYVFPVSGEQYSTTLPYCKYLSNAFKLTKPVYLHEYNSIRDCEDALISDTDLDYIYN